MFKPLPKRKYPIEMVYFLKEHILVIYVQNIKGPKRKTSNLLEKLLEKDLVHCVTDSIFKRLKFEYFSSKTTSNQKIKLRTIFLMTAYFWRSH